MLQSWTTQPLTSGEIFPNVEIESEKEKVLGQNQLHE